MRLMSLCIAAIAFCAVFNEQGRAANGGGASGVASSAEPLADGTVRRETFETLVSLYHPWINYRSFPRSIRPLLQRADFAHYICGASYPSLYKFHACNREWRLLRVLEQRGWCWGSDHRMASRAEEYYFRCSRLPHYRPGYLGSRPPFTEREIREMIREAAH